MSSKPKEWNIEVKDIFTSETKFYTLRKDIITVGRSDHNDIVIKNQYISGHHVTLTNKNGSLYVKDEKTSNGTEINLNYQWEQLKRERKGKLPIQLKLARAVILVIQTEESRLITLKEVERQESIMVLDLCDSTVISFKNDKMAFHLKKRLSAIAKPILFEENINFYKSTGDGFLATFSGPLQALDVAQKILQALKKRNGTTDNPPIQVRIGLHFGKTYIIDPVTDDIHGYDINLTFRLEGLKKAAFSKFFVKLPQVNRILATRSFYDQIDNRSKRKREDFRLIGPAKLKGVDEKIDIFDVAWDK